MRKWTVAVATVVGVGALLAGCGRDDPARRAERAEAYVGRKLERWVDRAGPSDAQRKQLAPIQERVRAEVPALVTGMEQARSDVRAQLEAASPDPARLHALVDERAEALRAVAHKLVDAVLEAHQVLSPEQRARLLRR